MKRTIICFIVLLTLVSIQGILYAGIGGEEPYNDSPAGYVADNPLQNTWLHGWWIIPLVLIVIPQCILWLGKLYDMRNGKANRVDKSKLNGVRNQMEWKSKGEQEEYDSEAKWGSGLPQPGRCKCCGHKIKDYSKCPCCGKEKP